MTGHDSHIGFLKDLAPAERERELTREVTDALQELVACVERSLPLEENTLRGCVIDDFQLHQPKLGEHDCRVPLRFSASARQGVGNAKRLERIQGNALAIIDESGRVSYRDVTFGEERAFVAHDLGGGD